MADHIGTRIVYWRRRRGGMTQAALAGLSGVSQSYISQVEAGHKSVERRSTLVALAGALQVTVADLLGAPGDSGDPVKDSATALVLGAHQYTRAGWRPRRSQSSPSFTRDRPLRPPVVEVRPVRWP